METEKPVGDNPGKKDPISKTPEAFEGWDRIGYFGSYFLYARENLRRIVEPDTGRILAQYFNRYKSRTKPAPQRFFRQRTAINILKVPTHLTSPL